MEGDLYLNTYEVVDHSAEEDKDLIYDTYLDLEGHVFAQNQSHKFLEEDHLYDFLEVSDHNGHIILDNNAISHQSENFQVFPKPFYILLLYLL